MNENVFWGAAKSFVEFVLQEIENNLAQGMMNGDNSKMMDMYLDDAVSLPNYSPMVRGKDAIKQNMEKESESGNKVTDFKINVTDVFGSGDMIVEIGTYVMTMEMKGMNDPVNDHGKYMTVYEKQDDGSLKIKSDTWNSDLNPWMPQQGMNDKKKSDE